jgi:hypothetical protein
MQKYRFIFLAHPDDDRALAAFELFAESPDVARGLAENFLDKSHAAVVEVWSEGRLILHVVRTRAAA